MTRDDHPVPIDRSFLTPGVWILLILTVVGACFGIYRFFFGLQASTNLNQQYPWGIWIVLDVSFIALAAGGFTLAGIIYDMYEYDISGGTWETKMKNGNSARVAWPRYWYFIGSDDTLDLIPVIAGYSAGSANIATTANFGKFHFNQVYVYDLNNTFD